MRSQKHDKTTEAELKTSDSQMYWYSDQGTEGSDSMHFQCIQLFALHIKRCRQNKRDQRTATIMARDLKDMKEDSKSFNSYERMVL